MNEQQLVVVWVSYIVSSISFVCTITNLWLIRAMNKWNGYLAIIASMCVCQIVYDVSFSLHISADNNGMAAVWNGLQFFGGMSVSIWTNILAVIILRVVLRKKSTDILNNFYFLSAIALFPSIVLGSLLIGVRGSTAYDLEEIYFWGRLVSIIINFVIHAIISYRSYQMNSSRVTSTRTPQEVAIQVLSDRMIYYPLMQTLSRIGASWYEAKYGFGPFPGDTSTYQFSLAIIYAATSPATGIGYLIIFLFMQPFAMVQLMSLMRNGKPIDPKILATRKNLHRRSSYLHRNTLVRSFTGSEFGPGSSTTDASDMQNHVSSLTTAPPPSIDEEEEAMYYMDDDELVDTIHRAEVRGTLSMRPPPAVVGDDCGGSLQTGATGITGGTGFTVSPILSDDNL